MIKDTEYKYNCVLTSATRKQLNRHWNEQTCETLLIMLHDAVFTRSQAPSSYGLVETFSFSILKQKIIDSTVKTITQNIIKSNILTASKISYKQK